ncbi:MAG: hypothetical protein WA190_03900 [Usitatibacter sp.]
MAEARLALHRRLRLAAWLVAMVVVLLAAPCASAFFTTDPNIAAVGEFYNDYTGHFFLAADLADEQALVSGQAGPGWHQTGKGFGAYTPASGFGVPVYRFYAPGPNSHFYTAEATELAALRDPASGWIDEGVKFRALLPTGGACQAGYSPLHRLYNNRAQFNDAAHRYVFDDTLRASMVASGWSDEGVHLCVRQPSSSAAYVFRLAPNAIRSAADCTNETVNLGSCIGMNALPASLPNHIVSWQPPSFVTLNPDWQVAYGDLTGAHEIDVFTAQAVGDEGAVLSHSYVQMYALTGDQGSSVVGMHTISTDASATLASIDLIFQFATGAPAAGQVDARAFPWRYSHENHLDLLFRVTAQTVHWADAQSQGYGGALIEFRDVTSGQSIDVSMLAYGSVAPGDFVGINDPATGNVWVGTTLGDAMLFGTSLGSSYVACGGGSCSPDVLHAFGVRLTADDFRGIVTRARSVNPVLSPDITKYILVNYLLRNGIVGNAEVGATVEIPSLSLFGY